MKMPDTPLYSVHPETADLRLLHEAKKW